MFRFATTCSMFLTFACVALAQEADESRQAQVERQQDLARAQQAQAERARNEAQRRLDVQDRAREETGLRHDLELRKLEAELRTLRAKMQLLDAPGDVEASPEARLRLRREVEVAEDRIAQLQGRRQALERREGPGMGRRPGPGGGNADPRPGAGGADERVRRIRHMRVAAENLRAAGMNDLAATVMSRVEAYEREVRESRMRQLPAPPPTSGREEIEALRRELQQLREEVRRLRAERGGDAMQPPRRPPPADQPLR